MVKTKLLHCDCGCNNKYKSRETIRRHRLKSVFNAKSANGQILAEKLAPQRSAMAPQIITKIDLNKEFRSMSEEVNPKKSDEKRYHCGNCQTKFDEVPAFCPGCGSRLK